MHHTTLVPLSHKRQAQLSRLLALALLPVLLLLASGRPFQTLPTPLAPIACVRRSKCPHRSPRRFMPARRLFAPFFRRSLLALLLQLTLLSLLLSFAHAPPSLLLLSSLPLLHWLLSLAPLLWPHAPHSASCRRLRLVVADLYLTLLLSLVSHLLLQFLGLAPVAALAAVASRARPPKPCASGRILDDGTYEVLLADQFAIRHKPVDEFDRRMFLLFLRDIHLVDRRSKWPFLCQTWLASWFSTLQELISRWEDYRAAGDWQRLMSRHDGPLLPYEQQQALVQLWARHLWWSLAEVHAAAHAQGLVLSTSAIGEIGQHSGLLTARRVLRERFCLSAELLRPKDDWLVNELFARIDQLRSCLEQGQPPLLETQTALLELETLRREMGLGTGRELATPLPWAYRLQQFLCGDWRTLDDGCIRCPHCGSEQVRRKSRKGRTKRYYDAAGQAQTLEVYRYYCCNVACAYTTFTNLPPELLPYSPWRAEVHLAALQAYELGRSSYRHVARGMGVSSATAYRWVSQFGGQLVPVLALFGLVRSSGVVGIDEKWVQVPRPHQRGRSWKYVYLAVDCYSYDLLHIAIYATVGTASAQAFLLALRAKGYRPQVVVTDLNQDYTAAIAAVFPQAEQHECVFHALQAWQKQLRQIYGKEYKKQPEVARLCQQLKRIFWAKTKRTAQRRYERVMELREKMVAEMAEVEGVFASLERHWPKLVNAIESERIPLTNNTTELVIRRFGQHYQNFCGFDSIETAETYLAVFEWCYRLTPFTQDAQQRIRGKSPLELAGYDVSKLPMAQICRGQLLDWPAEALGELVPKS